MSLQQHERDAPARFSLLARAGEILGAGQARRETLRRVAELLVPGLAGWCAIDLVDDDGTLAPRISVPERFPLTDRGGGWRLSARRVWWCVARAGAAPRE